MLWRSLPTITTEERDEVIPGDEQHQVCSCNNGRVYGLAIAELKIPVSSCRDGAPLCAAGWCIYSTQAVNHSSR